VTPCHVVRLCGSIDNGNIRLTRRTFLGTVVASLVGVLSAFAFVPMLPILVIFTAKVAAVFGGSRPAVDCELRVPGGLRIPRAT
jgi:hypothetical protein